MANSKAKSLPKPQAKTVPKSVAIKKTISTKQTPKTNKSANDDNQIAQLDGYQLIPLHQLSLSPKNVRKTQPSEQDDFELKNSIFENGLKQNLVVYPKGKDAYLVDAGGRRLKALQELAEEGKINKDMPIYCLVEKEDEATITSILENTHRAAMHPADQFKAFTTLIDEGRREEDIARKFGVSIDIVRKRLKLGRVHPDIFEAFRTDEIDLEVVMAFAVSDDHERQLTVWNTIKENHYHQPHHIKTQLTENKYSANAKLVRFIGVEAYEEAGGSTTTDLFSERDNTYLDDPALVERLATEKLQALGEKYVGIWKWVDVVLETNYDTFRSFGRIYPEDSKPDPKLTEKIDSLKAREDELHELSQQRELSDEESAEYEGIDDLASAVEAQVEDEEPYDAENRKRAGVVVTLDYQGNPDIRRGLVRPEDIEHLKSDENDNEENNTFSAPTSSAPITGYNAAATIRKSSGITAGLANDLRSTRHYILRAHLAGDFNVAFDAMLYTMICQALRHKYLSDLPIEATMNSYYEHNQKKLVEGSIADKMLTALKDDLNLDWTNLKQPEDFKAMSALSMEDKQALFAWASAYSIKAQLSNDDQPNKVIEEIGSRMDIDVAECWRPTAANYWGTVTKAHIGDIAKNIIGEDFALERLSEKKGEAAAAMDVAFSELAPTTTDLDNSVTCKTTRWLPEGMEFDEPYVTDDQSDNTANEDPTVNLDLPEFLQTTDQEASAA